MGEKDLLSLLNVILAESYGHSKLLNPHLELGFEDDCFFYFAKLFSRLNI